MAPSDRFDSGAQEQPANASASDNDAATSAGVGLGSGGQRRLQLHLLTRPEEAPHLLPIMAEAHRESPFGRFPFSSAKAHAWLVAELSRGDRQAGFYVTYGERIVGVAGVAAGRYYLSDEGVAATCLAFFVARDVRKSLLGAKIASVMLRALRGWATAKGATLLTIHGTNGHVGRMARDARMIGVNVVIPLGPGRLVTDLDASPADHAST